MSLPGRRRGSRSRPGWPFGWLAWSSSGRTNQREANWTGESPAVERTKQFPPRLRSDWHFAIAAAWLSKPWIESRQTVPFGLSKRARIGE